MSSNKTEHLGLHLWEPKDDFLRTEFNENSERMDMAAAIWPVTLLDVTTQEAATMVELDVSHIDFTAWLYLELYIVGALGTGSSNRSLRVRCNGLTEYYDQSSRGDNAYINLGSGSGDPVMWMKFPVGVPSGRAIVASDYYRTDTSSVTWGTACGGFPVTWGDLKSLQFFFEAEIVFPPGTRFILRGIKR